MAIEDEDAEFPIVWRGADVGETYAINSVEEIFDEVIPYWEKRGATSYIKILRKIGKGVCPHSIIFDSYLLEFALFISVLSNDFIATMPIPGKPVYDQPAIFFDVLGVYKEYEALKNKKLEAINKGNASANLRSVSGGNPKKFTR